MSDQIHNFVFVVLEEVVLTIGLFDLECGSGERNVFYTVKMISETGINVFMFGSGCYDMKISSSIKDPKYIIFQASFALIYSLKEPF